MIDCRKLNEQTIDDKYPIFNITDIILDKLGIYFNIPKYKIYETQHPSGRVRGNIAIIIKNNIKHYEYELPDTPKYYKYSNGRNKTLFRK